MKKVFTIISAIALVALLSACGEAQTKLYVLNWGEYMDPELIEAFEDEFDVDVVYEEVGSNEEMEIKIKSGITAYDIAIPSDYMIDKLRQQDLLLEINTDLLTSFEQVSVSEKVSSLYASKGYEPYLVPYFWGTIGIMYNTDTVAEEDLTGWDLLFDTETSYKIGMYDSARDSVAAALLYLGYDVNTNVQAELDEAQLALQNGVFDMFGEDNLKGHVIQGNIDLALVYSGDYFDELYAAEEDEVEANFAYFVPETTNVWVDAFVIPTTSEQTELAHEFINYFLREEVALQNADWVGYAPVLEEVFATITDVDGDYGYDYDNYDPAPEGSSRVVYEFVSNERFDLLNQILQSAKAE
jgi:spermidine/putrescine-binding protein